MFLYLPSTVPAGPPMDLMVMNISDTSATFEWSPPNDPGIPPLSYYRVIATPTPPSDVNLTTYSTTLLLYGMIPNTEYNVSVVGVATGGDQFNILMGQQSNQSTFQTLVGGYIYICNVINIDFHDGVLFQYHSSVMSLPRPLMVVLMSSGHSRILED